MRVWKKRGMALLLSVALVLSLGSLTACGGNTQKEVTETTTPTATQVAEPTAEPTKAAEPTAEPTTDPALETEVVVGEYMGLALSNISQLYSLILYAALAQSLVFSAFAGVIINILYGKAFISAVPVLRVLTWYYAFSFMGVIRNLWILAEQKQKYLWIINFLWCYYKYSSECSFNTAVWSYGGRNNRTCDPSFYKFCIRLYNEAYKREQPAFIKSLES